MDQQKTGRFIAQCRKEKELTQRELAERIGVSDKTVSKWECGNGLPEVSLMLPLCEVLGITVNELLSGETLGAAEYRERAEGNLVQLVGEKQENKKKTVLSAVVCVTAILSALTIILAASLANLPLGWRIALLAVAAVQICTGIAVGCVLDREGGYFECPQCKARFVPTMAAYVNGLHGITWRRLRCPECGKVSNCKKRLTKKTEEKTK